ncbi:hypothetical protein HU200_061667 [Digitaria exilis]|uniref:Uncharacterized protein n=1 Tax=Digitaria exilis TaxID=1010633 RepID=A0A835A4G6_9POAL|nr:hypothetical protein HU200_061667 [Digitaria exilis]
MAISSKTVAAMSMLLLIATCFVQLPVPIHARKLEARAPIISTNHHPCSGRSVLQVPAVEGTDYSNTSPGHSPSGGHGSPPGL